MTTIFPGNITEMQLRFCYHLKLIQQPVHSLLGGKGLGIQQEMSVRVGLPKSSNMTHHQV